jgi:hypothetical protein
MPLRVDFYLYQVSVSAICLFPATHLGSPCPANTRRDPKARNYKTPRPGRFLFGRNHIDL